MNGEHERRNVIMANFKRNFIYNYHDSNIRNDKPKNPEVLNLSMKDAENNENGSNNINDKLDALKNDWNIIK